MSAGDIWPTLSFRNLLLGGAQMDWVSDTVRLVLAKASLTAYVNAATSDLIYLTSITSEVVGGDGAATDGVVLTSKTLTVSSSFAIVKAAAVTFCSTSTGGTARYGLLVLDGASLSSSPVLAILDLGSDRALTGASNSTPLTITFTDNKVLKFSGTGTAALD